MPGRDSTRILEAEACKYFLIVSESMRDKFEGHVGPCFWAKYEWYVTMRKSEPSWSKFHILGDFRMNGWNSWP